VDGTVFSHSIFVGDPGAKGARPDDKVVFEAGSNPAPSLFARVEVTPDCADRGGERSGNDPSRDLLLFVGLLFLHDEASFQSERVHRMCHPDARRSWRQ